VAWEFGDGATGAGEAVVHRYNESGPFEVHANVTDALGNAAGTSLIIDPYPPLHASIASAATGRVGEPIRVDAVTTGGPSTPLTFAWSIDSEPSGLPNAPVLNVTPTAPGDLEIGLAVSDAEGDLARASAEVNVTAGPSTGPAPSSPPAATFLGLPPTLAYAVIEATIAVILVGVLAGVLRRRHH
jgi:hypothetical protein